MFRDRPMFMTDSGLPDHRPLVPRPTVGMPTFVRDRFLDRLRHQVVFAFQPIVNVFTGATYAHEALLRGQKRMGFDAIGELFDHAYEIGVLHRVDMILRETAIKSYADFAHQAGTKLFYNLDNRLLDSADYRPGETPEVMVRHGLDPSRICFEISEKHEIAHGGQADRMLDTYKRNAYHLAIDDFGTGHSGLKLLYQHQPHFIKIDRFFISGIAADPKKRFLVSSVVNVAHVLGIQVIAEGIETEAEFLTCKELGCDLAQGYFIGRPTLAIGELRALHESVAELSRRHRRGKSLDQELVADRMEVIPPLAVTDSMEAVFATFRTHKHVNFFPVVDERGEPLGLLHEKELKEYIYAPYGKDLIANRTCGKTLRHFLSPCPVADIRCDAERILGIYTLSGHQDGIVITRDRVYAGFLSAASLLRVINEKNLAVARDQNPLTKLPGNNSINDYLVDVIEPPCRRAVLVYVDFDHFKPFNDAYGFRQGDRAILLFADLMHKHCAGAFLGHIGGDDFFIGFDEECTVAVLPKLVMLLETFRRDVESFYDREARERGYIEGKGRDGRPARLPLLGASAAVLEVPPGRGPFDVDDLSRLIATMKSEAKASFDHICVASLALGRNST